MSETGTLGSTAELVDHFFRHESARVISHLTAHFGTRHLEEAEDAVQEALIKAMHSWPRGVPNNPSAWILTVARNKIIDTLRRNKKIVAREEEDLNRKIEAVGESTTMSDVELEDFLKDDLLKMMFACCDPSLTVESQIILTLRILCGLGNSEVARALIKNDEAIAKAYTRAKQKLRDSKIVPAVPTEEKAKEQLTVVLKVLYLLFNEGYKSSSGNDLIKRDLCLESMRLTKILCDSPFGRNPELNALMSLMCFHTSRFESRVDKHGALLTLKEQDRSTWNAELIEMGSFYFQRSFANDFFETMTEYHVLAAMAGLHCQSKDYESTDWEQLLGLYDLQMASKPSPVVELNRLVVYAEVHGANKALTELSKLENQAFLSSYYLFYAVKGDLLSQLEKTDDACEALSKAIELTENATEKKHLEKKLAALIV